MSVGAPELAEVERIIIELQGTNASHGRVGVLQLDRSRLRLDTGNIDSTLEEAPDVLKLCAARLRALEAEHGPAVSKARSPVAPFTSCIA